MGATTQPLTKQGAVHGLVIAATGLVAFATSLVWYSPLLFGDVWMRYQDPSAATVPTWTFAFAPLREITTAAVLSFLIVRVRPHSWRAALRLGFVLWVGFYVVQLSGAVMFDRMPWPLGSIHAGDWLMKLLVITLTLSAWHRRAGVFGRRTAGAAAPPYAVRA